jgi:hypothetical protein
MSLSKCLSLKDGKNEFSVSGGNVADTAGMYIVWSFVFVLVFNLELNFSKPKKNVSDSV